MPRICFSNDSVYMFWVSGGHFTPQVTFFLIKKYFILNFRRKLKVILKLDLWGTFWLKEREDHWKLPCTDKCGYCNLFKVAFIRVLVMLCFVLQWIFVVFWMKTQIKYVRWTKMFKLPTLSRQINLKTSMTFKVKMKKNAKQEFLCERRLAGPASKNMTGRVCICEGVWKLFEKHCFYNPFWRFS